MRLYHSDRGLYDFQAEDIARGYLMPSGLVTWDTGTGKTHWAMAYSALRFEDDLTDLVLLVCESGKVGEWVQDFEKFTSLTVMRYHGTGRQKRLEKAGVPQVLVTTYETSKADLVRIEATPGKRGKTITPGPLAGVIGDRRVTIIYDESTKLGNRSSDIYKGHHHYVNRIMRKAHPDSPAWGLTATPLETGYENAYNQARLLWPPAMPIVKEFEEKYISSRDPYGRPQYRKDRMPEFAKQFQAISLRRRKTDPELIDQFPKMVEESTHFTMGEDQRKFYEMVEEIGFPADADQPEPGMLTTMRQIAAHPASLLYAEGTFSRILVEELGANYLRGLSSVKTDGMISWLRPIMSQGDKAIVFTFFGQSVLPLLANAARDSKIRVFTNHGGLSMREREKSKSEFKAFDGPAVFLTSDAGARGINLPEAFYLCEYESAVTYALRTQRINRIHRIDSVAPTTNAMTFILDGTAEESLALGMSRRNEQSDILLGDDQDGGDDFLTAAERKVALRIARTRSPRRKKAA